MNTLRTFSILVALVAAPALALAQPGGDKPSDHGRHGQLDPAERAAKLKKFDRNGDGKLDDAERATMRAERQQAHAAERAAKVKKFDRNGDGKLDDAERAAMQAEHAQLRFDRLDLNRDNLISRDEFAAGFAKLRQGHGGRGKHRGDRAALEQPKRQRSKAKVIKGKATGSDVAAARRGKAIGRPALRQ